MKKPAQLVIEQMTTLDNGVVIRLSSYAPALTTPRGKFLRYDLSRIITAISLAAGEDGINLIRIGKVDDDFDSLNILKVALKIDDKKFKWIINEIRVDQGVVALRKGVL